LMPDASLCLNRQNGNPVIALMVIRMQAVSLIGM
jgi:hypothetical protein